MQNYLRRMCSDLFTIQNHFCVSPQSCFRFLQEKLDFTLFSPFFSQWKTKFMIKNTECLIILTHFTGSLVYYTIDGRYYNNSDERENCKPFSLMWCATIGLDMTDIRRGFRCYTKTLSRQFSQLNEIQNSQRKKNSINSLKLVQCPVHWTYYLLLLT